MVGRGRCISSYAVPHSDFIWAWGNQTQNQNFGNKMHSTGDPRQGTGGISTPHSAYSTNICSLTAYSEGLLVCSIMINY
uniref:Uncharacterized protein n=1 Tax=Physcomitrium patens TaxID=3218 RepID=A0A2K1JMU4_PHYPA|nr:hypothetical protein PHYPA_017696 [Physcomitrium patens]